MRYYWMLLSLFFFLFTGCEKEGSDEEDQEKKATGELAERYLQDHPYRELVFHLIYMKGYAPKGRAKDSLKSFLERYPDKPDGVRIIEHEVGSGGKSAYSIEDIDPIIGEHERSDKRGEAVHAYLLVVDGSYSEDGSNTVTLGIAYSGRRMALFGESIRDHSDEVTEPERWKLQATVLNHEFAHLLGLVNNGTPMINEHQDKGNGHHCDDEDCLMYYTVETSDIVGKLVSSPIPDLDQECRNDLTANGGK